MNQVSHLEDKGGEEEKGDEEDRIGRRGCQLSREVKMSIRSSDVLQQGLVNFSVKKKTDKKCFRFCGPFSFQLLLQLCHYNRDAGRKKTM